MNGESKVRILIVENSQTQALDLAHTIELEGFMVVLAANGHEAFEILKNNTPDLILLDEILPDITGRDWLYRVRNDFKVFNIPVIMLTMGNKETGYSTGVRADDYIAKEAEKEVVISCIKYHLEQTDKFRIVLKSEDFSKAKILAVDDSPTYLEFLAESLKAAGLNVDKETNGKNVLEGRKYENYDLLLLDLKMPEIDGIELTGKILRERTSFSVQPMILMLTMQESREDMTRALEAGADDFVGKSSDISVVLARIHALVRRKFIQDENRRIINELKNRELEIKIARYEKKAGEARAVLSGQLEKTVEELRVEIKERKLAEEKLTEYSRRLKLSNQALDDFSYIASHDLKEPLRGINYFSSFLLEDYEDKLDEDGRKYLENLVRLSKRMSLLIESLLEFSRLGRLDPKLVETDLNELLKEVQEDLIFLTSSNNVQIDIKKELPRINCDEHQIQEVFSNLIINAVKYNDKEKKLINIDFDYNKKAGEYTFMIADNGIGISETHKKLVFRIFKRLHGRDEYGGGTGAGLTIVEKIIQRHGGRIWIESEVDKGTKMFFTLRAK